MSLRGTNITNNDTPLIEICNDYLYIRIKKKT